MTRFSTPPLSQMHPLTGAPSTAPPHILDRVNELLTRLLHTSLSVKSFTGRCQIIRSKLASLQLSLSEISDSPHWSGNSLLQTLLPNLLATLRRIEVLLEKCTVPGYSTGKLLMQSDLDMATGWLSKQIQDIDLLLKSGVLRQSNAIVLSHPAPGSDLEFFVRDLFTRLQIGGVEFRKKAMESLLQLLSDDQKAANVVAKEGNLSCLIHLLDLNSHQLIREQAVTAVSILATASDQSRKCIFEEGGLGPLLRVIESGSTGLKEKAAVAVEAITADIDNAWAISAYGGVSVLIEACRSGSLSTQAHAVGALRNVAGVEDIRTAFYEEGAVPVLVQLLISGSASAQEKSANCIAILASSGEQFRSLIMQEKGLQRLLQLLQESTSSSTLEHVLRAILSISASDSASRTLSSSTKFIIQLAGLIKHGNILLQHISATLLAKLWVAEADKRAISSCIPTLLKLMESSKPDGLPEVAAKALVSLLSVKSNRKELVKDEKSLMRLTQMLDPKIDSVSKDMPVAVVSAVMSGGSQGCRKRLVGAGAYAHLQRLAEMDVAGAKKAMQRLSGNRLKTIFTRNWTDSRKSN